MASNYTPAFSHVGISRFDIERMAQFYCAVLELQVTDKGMAQTLPVPVIFLSGNSKDHHQVAFSKNRPEGSTSTVMQISFKVGTLDDLRVSRDRAVKHGATNLISVSHGNAVAIYFQDPEQNLVEVHIDTPWYVRQPHGRPFDLDRPDDEIWAEIEKTVRADPTFMRVEEWSAGFANKLAGRA